MQYEGIIRTILLAMAILAVIVCFVLGAVLWNDYQIDVAKDEYWEMIQETTERS